jgi:predicted dehydrogenase
VDDFNAYAQAGVDIMLEKPPGASVEETRQILAAAEAARSPGR